MLVAAFRGQRSSPSGGTDVTTFGGEARRGGARKAHERSPPDRGRFRTKRHKPGKTHKRYELGVKASMVVTHKNGLVGGARSFPGNPYDGHVLAAQLEQTNILLKGAGKLPKQVFVDMGYRSFDHHNPKIEVIRHGNYKLLIRRQRRCRRRRLAVEPTTGHLKADQRLDCCWLRGQLGDALHTVLFATGDNLRWLLRAMVRLRLQAVFMRSLRLMLVVATSGRRRPSGGASRVGLRLAGLVDGFRRALIVRLDRASLYR